MPGGTAAQFAEARRRLGAVLARADPLERQGFPFGSLAFRNAFEEHARSGSIDGATGVVARATALLDLADRAWGEVRSLLAQVDELSGLAEGAGMNAALVLARVGNPRVLLVGRPMTPAALESVAHEAAYAAATLREAIPAYCVEEARTLGTRARELEARGRDTHGSAAALDRLVRALDARDLATASRAVAEARRSLEVAEGTRSVVSIPRGEEEDILREARSLARRLPRREPRPRSTVPRTPESPETVPPSEDDTLSPEEEIESLWTEVLRLAGERELARSAPGAGRDEPEAPSPAPRRADRNPVGVPPPVETEPRAPETHDLPPYVGPTTADLAVEARPGPDARGPVDTAPADRSQAKHEELRESGPNETMAFAARPDNRRVGISAAYVPPGTGAHAKARPLRAGARRTRSRHRGG